MRGGIVTWKGVRRTKSKYSSHYPCNHPTKLELSMPAFDVSTNICAGVVCRIQIYNYNLIHTADTVSLPPPHPPSNMTTTNSIRTWQWKVILYQHSSRRNISIIKRRVITSNRNIINNFRRMPWAIFGIVSWVASRKYIIHYYMGIVVKPTPTRGPNYITFQSNIPYNTRVSLFSQFFFP